MTAFVLSQIFVGVSSALYALSLLVKSKKILLLVQIISSIFFVAQYLLLGAYLGGLVAGLELIRTITFYFIDKNFNTNKVRFTASAIFIVVGIIGSIFTWATWYSVLPLLGLLAVTTCLAFNSIVPLKLSCIFSAICAGIYLIFLKSYFGFATQVFIIVIGVTGLITMLIKNKKQLKQEDANGKENI